MGCLGWMGESGVGCGGIIITVYGGYIQCMWLLCNSIAPPNVYACGKVDSALAQ